LGTGDTLLNVNDIKINTWNIEKVLKDNINKTLALSYKKGSKIVSRSITCPKDDCILGITYITSANKDDIKEIKFPLLTSMKYGAKEIWAQTRMTLGFLGTLGKNIVTLQRTDLKESLHKMTGPA